MCPYRCSDGSNRKVNRVFCDGKINVRLNYGVWWIHVCGRVSGGVVGNPPTGSPIMICFYLGCPRLCSTTASFTVEVHHHQLHHLKRPLASCYRRSRRRCILTQGIISAICLITSVLEQKMFRGFSLREDPRCGPQKIHFWADVNLLQKRKQTLTEMWELKA